MAGDRATDILREEHESIRKVVASMAVLLMRLETGGEVKPELLQSAVEFMKLAGGMHERKEEEFLFPMLDRKGVSTSVAPISLLTRNHRQARDFATRLGAAADTSAAGWMPMDSPVMESLQGLTDIYPRHLWQEDMLIYRIADRSLGPEDDEQLMESFRGLETGVSGDLRQRMRELADEVDAEAWRE